MLRIILLNDVANQLRQKHKAFRWRPPETRHAVGWRP
jgi:hypothetical protein